jgi:hypothetical protein
VKSLESVKKKKAPKESFPRGLFIKAILDYHRLTGAASESLDAGVSALGSMIAQAVLLSGTLSSHGNETGHKAILKSAALVAGAVS